MDPNLIDDARLQQTIDTDRLDLSTLVGHAVAIYSEQFPGQLLESRVLEAHDGVISIDRSGSGRRIDNLVHNQRVTVQFPYKGERVCVRAMLKRTGGGKCRIAFDSQAIALTRRQFCRVPLALPTKLTVLPQTALKRDRLARLRWIQTNTINFSSGGVLLELSGGVNLETLMMMNLAHDQFDFPALVVAQVRHCHQVSTGVFHAGVEFVLREVYPKIITLSTSRELPPAVFEYDSQQRL